MVGRANEFGLALAALKGNQRFRGVVLLGDGGSGKSTLARALAEAVEPRGIMARFVLGTETASSVPLGAFCYWLTVDTASEHAAMLAAAQRILEQQKNLVLVIDDAHLLDALSALLVYQLAAQGNTRLIVTIRSGGAAPEAVRALWEERMLLPLRINAFTWQQTAELTRTVLGGAIEDCLISELHRQSAGNPRVIRGLLSASGERCVLVRTEDGWQVRGVPQLDRQCSTPEGREAIGILDAAEEVAHVDRGGAVRAVPRRTRSAARQPHPVMRESTLRKAEEVRTCETKSVLAGALRKAEPYTGSRRITRSGQPGTARPLRDMKRSAARHRSGC